jgi:Na+-transporting NADH:ubiquinone oxidoreductase subunit C
LKWFKADGSDASDSDDLTGDGKVDMADIDAAKAAAKGTDNTPSLGVVYLRKDDDGVGATGIPVEGMGLWGPISGYIALNPSGNEVSGATFFAPKETPGLGAEITLPAFEKQFTGKRIVDGAGKPKTIRVVKGAAKTLCPGEDLAHCVDGVSGATITCRGVDEMIAKAVKDYGPYLNRIRGM